MVVDIAVDAFRFDGRPLFRRRLQKDVVGLFMCEHQGIPSQRAGAPFAIVATIGVAATA